MSGVSRGYANWFDEISNVSGTVSDGVKTTLDSAFGNVTSMLEGNKVSWKSWGISVLQIIEKVALQMAVVSAMGGASSGSGIFGSLIGSVGSFFGAVREHQPAPVRRFPVTDRTSSLTPKAAFMTLHP
jgi:lambda family phage tail tape measure protein